MRSNLKQLLGGCLCGVCLFVGATCTSLLPERKCLVGEGAPKVMQECAEETKSTSLDLSRKGESPFKKRHLDVETGLWFERSLAKGKVLCLMTYGSPRLGYGIRYEGDDFYFDVCIYGSEKDIPDGEISQGLVQHMINHARELKIVYKTIQFETENPLSFGELKPTGIAYLKLPFKYERLNNDRLQVFFSSTILFVYRGKFIKLRISGVQQDVSVFNAVESRILDAISGMMSK